MRFGYNTPIHYAPGAPSGEVVARCTTDGDEVVVAACDLDGCEDYRSTVFDFERYRRPELYGAIAAT